MADIGDRFREALEALEEVTREITPDAARHSLDDTTLQVFWRDWTGISAWAGALWRSLSEELEEPARPAVDDDLDEVGSGG